MTPKEKAQELFKKYYPLVYCFSGSGMLTNTEDETTKVKYAKQCALIAVDEILKDKAISTTNEHLLNIFLSYWSEVKREIEKL